MRFLLQRYEPERVQTALIVQTCNSDLFTHVVRDARRRFASAHLVVLRQKGMRELLPADLPADEWLDNPHGGKRDLLRDLRGRRFDAVCFVDSGESGFWKLKSLPWLLHPRAVYVYDRRAQPTHLSIARAFATLSVNSASTAALLTRRRLLSPLIFWQCWRFYRERRREMKTP
jgi:hypothetical protein